MPYTIGQAAQKIGLSAHTLRYYDKEGLLPFVHKTKSGARLFTESDMEWLLIIDCLKATGMAIKDIKQYIDWCQAGDSTIPQRLEMFKTQKEKVENEIKQLKKCLQKVNFKIAFYEDAAAHGNVDVYKRNTCLAEAKKKIFKQRKA